MANAVRWVVVAAVVGGGLYMASGASGPTPEPVSRSYDWAERQKENERYRNQNVDPYTNLRGYQPPPTSTPATGSLVELDRRARVAYTKYQQAQASGNAAEIQRAYDDYRRAWEALDHAKRQAAGGR
jgi:hypothetical protein